jgi:glutaminyl-peptide cyclotransferase
MDVSKTVSRKPPQRELRPSELEKRRYFRRFVFVYLPIALGVLIVIGLGLQRILRPSMPESDALLTPAPIDGVRAYDYLKQICALGPRPAGSAANTEQRKLVAEHFKKTGAVVREQPFSAQDPLSGAPVAMVNLIGSWFPDRTDRVVIGAHYDTRPYPDREPDPRKRHAPFLGANDGASGVALLMEMANHMSETHTPWGVDLVLFDGEELVYDQTGDYFLGSKEFGRVYQADRRAGTGGAGKTQMRYVWGIVLDMVGDRNLTIDQEGYSLTLAPALVRDVWSVAQKLKAKGFRNRAGQSVSDDHLPLNDAGIPTIDIIDFEYKYWHTAGDLPEQCSAASLAEVGRVVTAWLALPKPKERR